MNQKELMEFATKGIMADIRELEAKVRKGKQILDDMKNGKNVWITKNEAEVHEIVRKAEAEIEELASKKFDIDWELSVNKDLE